MSDPDPPVEPRRFLKFVGASELRNLEARVGHPRDGEHYLSIDADFLRRMIWELEWHLGIIGESFNPRVRPGAWLA